MDKVYVEACARRMHPDLDWPTPSDEVKELMERYGKSDKYDALSEWFSHRNIPTPYGVAEYINVTVSHYNTTTYKSEIDAQETRKVLARIVQTARKLGHDVTKEYADDYFKVIVTLNPVGCKVTYVANRESMCERKVVGKKYVPATYVDEVEYNCERVALTALDVDV